VAAATQWDQGDANRSVAPSTGPDASPDGAVRLDPLTLATQGPDDVLDVLALVVHRLFGIGLEVQSAAGVVDGPASDRLQLVVDELDELIRDARSMAFERIRGARAPGLSGVDEAADGVGHRDGQRTEGELTQAGLEYRAAG
jgi:hypothetical protein